MTFSTKNWSRLSVLLDNALDIPSEQRIAWLEGLALDDQELEAQLREIFNSPETSGFLQHPPNFTLLLKQDAQYPRDNIELQPDKLIGSYRLVRELGHGGMGSVWLASRVDGKFKREVALKLPYAGPYQRQLAERLIRERDILAGLQHANIARMYDADTTSLGQPFLVLEYIDGIPIHKYCDQQQLDINARLMLFQQVLSAVRYAHSRSVIHRDIKPSNILVTSDGVAHLLDFGIATLINDGEVQETPLTLFGGHLLTPEYASPEQISKVPVTTASDVYSLGVVLYGLLTGASPYPYSREQRAQLEQAIANADVIPPSRALISNVAASNRNAHPLQLRRMLRGEIDVLLLKALKKNIDDRYASADAFYEDIKRYLAHQPILAQPDSEWYRIKKFAQRNRAAVASVAAIVVALLTGTGFALWQAHQAALQRDRAVALATRGEAVTEFMQLMVTGIADADEPITMQTLLTRTEAVASKTFANNTDEQIAILTVLGEYYLSLQRSDLALQSLNKALDLAKNSSDIALKALLNCGVGTAYYEMGDIKTAQHFSETGLALSESYPEEHAECLLNHAFITFEAGGGADSMLKELLQSEKEIESSKVYQPMFRIELVKSIADAETELGRIADAQQRYASAIEQLNKMGQGEESTAMRVYDSWAIADGASGNPRSALEHIDKARKIAEKRGVHKNTSARYSLDRARLLYNLASYKDALQEYQAAIRYNESNGNLASVVNAKQGIARIMLATDHVSEAAQIIHETTATLSKPELGANSVFAIHVAELDGLLAVRQHRYDEGIRKFTANINYFIAHNQRAGALTYTLRLRGNVYLTTNNIAAALADATQSYDIARAMQKDLQYSSYTGKAALLLANIELKRNRSSTAQKWATVAYQQLLGSLGDEHPDTIEAKQLLHTMQTSN